MSVQPPDPRSGRPTTGRRQIVTAEIATLVAQFPRIFKGVAPQIRSRLPAGWMPLTTQLFQSIDEMLSDGEAERLTIIQIKEKFATLNVYWDLATQEPEGAGTAVPEAVSDGDQHALTARISNCVGVAVRASRETCQWCGASGATQAGRTWVWTLCEPCTLKSGVNL